jgi:hypothetical protein
MKNTIYYFDVHAMIAIKNLYLAIQIKEWKYKAYGNSLKVKIIIFNYIPFGNGKYIFWKFFLLKKVPSKFYLK